MSSPTDLHWQDTLPDMQASRVIEKMRRMENYERLIEGKQKLLVDDWGNCVRLMRVRPVILKSGIPYPTMGATYELLVKVPLDELTPRFEFVPEESMSPLSYTLGFWAAICFRQTLLEQIERLQTEANVSLTDVLAIKIGSIREDQNTLKDLFYKYVNTHWPNRDSPDAKNMRRVVLDHIKGWGTHQGMVAQCLREAQEYRRTQEYRHTIPGLIFY